MLFNIFKSKPRNPGRYLSEQEAKEYLVPGQIASNYPLLEALRQHGVTESDQLKLEFAFFTDDIGKAENLKKMLSAKGDYSVDDLRRVKKLWRLTGWSNKIKMDIDSINHWTFEMCKMGFDNDCKFDGWGTFPEKKD
jgi:hypothetical protein